MSPMAHWLVKSDPDDYGFGDLERDRRTRWDGVTNALALRHLRAMRRGDRCLIYETGKVRAVVGTATVASAPVEVGDDPRLVAVDLVCGFRLARPVTLAEIKADPRFRDFALVRQGRLSVAPVPTPLWKRLLKMAEA